MEWDYTTACDARPNDDDADQHADGLPGHDKPTPRTLCWLKLIEVIGVLARTDFVRVPEKVRTTTTTATTDLAWSRSCVKYTPANLRYLQYAITVSDKTR